MTYNFIVIGAGSAGLTMASAASKFGASVLLIENHKMGGDCLNTGCVPSKALLKFSHASHNLKKFSKLGFNNLSPEIEFSKIMDYVEKSIKAIEPKDSKERYQKLGVDVIYGEPSFIDNHTVSVNNKNFPAKNIVIATGSRPFIPKIPGLKEGDFFTSEDIFTMKTLPKNLLVIGAGAIGLELGQGFSQLGSKVYVLNKHSTIFSKDDSEVSDFMMKKLKNDGMVFVSNSKVIEIKKEKDTFKIFIDEDGKIRNLEVDAIFIAAGRVPNTENLNLESIGVTKNKKGYVHTDLRMRTSVKNIYACGDITGHYGFTHMASYEASIVLKNSIFKLPSKADYSKKAWTTFTIPSISHSGLTETEAKELGRFGKAIMLNFKNSDRFIIENETDGFLKVILDSKKRVIGATLVSENSEELIHSISLLISKNLKLSSFLDVIIPYPMKGEILKEAALSSSEELLTPFRKKLIKKLFL